jgi:hypothetical protein
VCGASREAKRQEAYEGESQQQGAGMLRRMSPWVVRCELNDETLDQRAITADEVRGAAEGLCRECGGDGRAVTSFRDGG